MDDDAGGPTEAERRFYRGTIGSLFHGSQSGVVRSDSGRELPFFGRSVRLEGRIRRFEELREEMRVGFDVGRTSEGLHVTLLRVEDRTD